MTANDRLSRGREAFDREAWSEAYACLLSADQETTLEPEDLERLAKAAYLIGNASESIGYWSQAHRKFQDSKNIPKAVYCAFWLGMILFDQGDRAQGGGWMARARRLIDECEAKCAEQGLVLIPEALQLLREGDAGAAVELFSKVIEFGSRFNNPDLTALGQLGRGQALIRQQKITEGTTLLDESMIAVVSEEVSPLVAGLVYCAVIETCQKIYDLKRALEWTEALSRWCESHPELVPYRGQCLVRRAEIMQLHGQWGEAITEVQQACEMLTSPTGVPAAGEAFYRQAELYRLQGNFSEAVERYRKASEWGRKPQPGLALLRLYEGKLDVAKAAIRQLETEKQDPAARSAMLPAYVEIMLESKEYSLAKTAADELDEIANTFNVPYLQAISGYTSGSVSLASGDPQNALERLRPSLTLFNKIEASYLSARTRVIVGQACRELDDIDTAELEFETARSIFQKLGAQPDLEKVNALINTDSRQKSHGLTSREREILQHLATGATNKEIAANLFISERTVDRHVSNILAKLDVPSRAAATAYAYEHNLI